MLRMDRGRNGDVRLTFVLPADQPLGRVSVVGDFNRWLPGAHELRKRSNGTRSLSVTVPEGTSLRFRYLAENDHWSNETDHPAVRQVGLDSFVVATAPTARRR
jgi:1,4-alpha-glucan branching enzyme